MNNDWAIARRRFLKQQEAKKASQKIEKPVPTLVPATPRSK